MGNLPKYFEQRIFWAIFGNFLIIQNWGTVIWIVGLTPRDIFEIYDRDGDGLKLLTTVNKWNGTSQYVSFFYGASRTM